MSASVAAISRALADPDAPQPKRRQPEFRLQVAVADQIRLRIMPGVCWSALPFGELRTKKTAARLKRMGVMPGWPDFMFLVEGLAIGLELKTEKDALYDTRRGYLSPEQKAVQVAWEAGGGKYILGRGFQPTLDALEINGIIRPDRSFRRVADREPA